MNKVFLSGNLTQDPEVRYSQSGTAYTKTGIGVRRAFSKNGDGQNNTDFFNLTLFGKQAEFCGRYLKKGSRVLVEGRIENDNYEDKNGVKHYRVNIMVDSIEFADSKRSGGDDSGGENYRNNSGGGNYGNNSGSNYGGDNSDVDVPF